MPTWGDILLELRQTAELNPTRQVDFDAVRRKYLSQLHALTRRDTILYYTDWLGSNDLATAITLEDMQAMMEVCKDLNGPGLDLILHTPGGTAEAVASVVAYLRQKFTDIRVFVPVAAMSAGTMWALACDQIVMGKHSQLGPIDPQMRTGQGFAPARAIIGQFERAKREITADPSALQAWFPILQQYGVSLLQECEAAEALGHRLVKRWLMDYNLLEGEEDIEKHAQAVADYFGDFENHKSHTLGIMRQEVQDQGLKVLHLEADQALQDAILSVHHATFHTFQGQALKIVENHLHRAFVKMGAPMAIPQLQIQQPGNVLPMPTA
jgi:hypothetical protein